MAEYRGGVTTSFHLLEISTDLFKQEKIKPPQPPQTKHPNTSQTSDFDHTFLLIHKNHRSANTSHTHAALPIARP
jgi:hypothetical protein